MKKLMVILLYLCFMPILAHAEDIYCGDFNGLPAYVELESIDRTVIRSGYWEITSDGIYPQYYRNYVANIYADSLWYKVYFSIESQRTVSVWIYDKYKKNAFTPISTINFDFAYPTVEEYYPEATQIRNDAAKKSLEAMDRKNIEEAKKNNQ